MQFITILALENLYPYHHLIYSVLLQVITVSVIDKIWSNDVIWYEILELAATSCKHIKKWGSQCLVQKYNIHIETVIN
jgi:hypothetical protein